MLLLLQALIVEWGKIYLNSLSQTHSDFTLEGSQKYPMIEAIEVVCIEGWDHVVWAYAEQFGISKLKWMTMGGSAYLAHIIKDKFLCR